MVLRSQCGTIDEQSRATAGDIRDPQIGHREVGVFGLEESHRRTVRRHRDAVRARPGKVRAREYASRREYAIHCRHNNVGVGVGVGA